MLTDISPLACDEVDEDEDAQRMISSFTQLIAFCAGKNRQGFTYTALLDGV